MKSENIMVIFILEWVDKSIEKIQMGINQYRCDICDICDYWISKL